jgi:DNA-binding GntR family transcriptional regulator
LRQRNEVLAATIEKGVDPLGAIEDELNLHSWCYEVSGHQLLLQSWNRMRPNLQFYFAMHQQAHERRGPLRQAHDTYIRLAGGNDLDAMLEHLVDHMRQGLQTTISFIESAEQSKAG